MRYWLNIHHPAEINQPRDQFSSVYLMEKHINTAFQKIARGDKAVLYEIDWWEGRPVVCNGKSLLLQSGRKGIVAIVKIGNYKPNKHVWDDDEYMGEFETQPIKVSKGNTPLVSLAALRQAWQNEFGKDFNPRILGGLRELEPIEWQAIATLLGVSPSDPRKP